MIISSTNDRVLAPEGQTAAVCVDFVDLGVVADQQFGPKHKVELVFETPYRHPEQGYALTVKTRANVTFTPNARLRTTLEQWRGKKYSDAEAKEGVDLEKCIGRPAFLNIEHSEDGQYANISAIMPMPAGLPTYGASGDYTRLMEKDGGWDIRSPNSTAGKPKAGAPAPPPQARPVNAEAQIYSGDGGGPATSPDGLRREPGPDGGVTVHDDNLPF